MKANFKRTNNFDQLIEVAYKPILNDLRSRINIFYTNEGNATNKYGNWKFPTMWKWDEFYFRLGNILLYKSLVCKIGRDQPIIADILASPIMYTHVQRNYTGGFTFIDIVDRSVQFDKVR